MRRSERQSSRSADPESTATEAIEIRIATVDDSAMIADLAGELGYPTELQDAVARLTAVQNSAEHSVFVATLPGGSVVGRVHVFLALRVESAPERLGFDLTKDQRVLDENL